jgi:hypothetical protein
MLAILKSMFVLFCWEFIGIRTFDKFNILLYGKSDYRY